MNTCSCTIGYTNGQYKLPDLPYDAVSLELFLDADTIRLHHDRHHAAYVNGANAAAASLQAIARGEAPSADAGAATRNLTFNLAGHMLHCIYWQSISPEPQSAPSGALAAALDSCFGGFESFCEQFRRIVLSIQGNGWGVLATDPLSKKLIILAVHSHQDALVSGIWPLMACDVWEHAYYLRYRNDRAAYVDAFIRHIDWAFVSASYNRLLTPCNHEQD